MAMSHRMYMLADASWEVTSSVCFRVRRIFWTTGRVEPETSWAALEAALHHCDRVYEVFVKAVLLEDLAVWPQKVWPSGVNRMENRICSSLGGDR